MKKGSGSFLVQTTINADLYESLEEARAYEQNERGQFISQAAYIRRAIYEQVKQAGFYVPSPDLTGQGNKGVDHKLGVKSGSHWLNKSRSPNNKTGRKEK